MIIAMMLTLTSCGPEPCTTKVCMDYKVEQQKLQQEQLLRDREFELKKLEVRAKIEAAKPAAVKVAEIENDGMSLGEGVATAGTVITVGSVVRQLLK